MPPASLAVRIRRAFRTEAMKHTAQLGRLCRRPGPGKKVLDGRDMPPPSPGGAYSALVQGRGDEAVAASARSPKLLNDGQNVDSKLIRLRRQHLAAKRSGLVEVRRITQSRS